MTPRDRCSLLRRGDPSGRLLLSPETTLSSSTLCRYVPPHTHGLTIPHPAPPHPTSCVWVWQVLCWDEDAEMWEKRLAGCAQLRLQTFDARVKSAQT